MLLNRTKLEKNVAKITISVDVFKDALSDEGTPNFTLKNNRTIVISNREVLRLFNCYDSRVTTSIGPEFEDTFWKIMTLLMIDSFVDEQEQVDEITGTPNMIFGKTQGEN